MTILREDLKIQIMIAALQERYNASHKIRERSTQFTIWISGLSIGLAWMLISKKGLTGIQLISVRILILALWGGAVAFLLGLRRGFNGNHRAMITCEKALGMYDEGLYLEDISLLPASYAKPRKKWCNHFASLCLWLCIIAASLLALTWTCPRSVNNGSSIEKRIEAVKGEKNNG